MRDVLVHMIEEHAEHLEIACDESGFSGGNLVGGESPVFAHASVRIEPSDARSWSIACCGKSAPTAAASTRQPNSSGHVAGQSCWA